MIARNELVTQRRKCTFFRFRCIYASRSVQWYDDAFWPLYEYYLLYDYVEEPLFLVSHQSPFSATPSRLCFCRWPLCLIRTLDLLCSRRFQKIFALPPLGNFEPLSIKDVRLQQHRALLRQPCLRFCETPRADCPTPTRTAATTSTRY